MQVKIVRTADDHLSHAGKKGMKWGYNDGRRNGKRTVGEYLTEFENEASRKIQNAGYDVKTQILEKQKTKAMENGDIRTSISVNMQLGHNYVMQTLNTIGDGRMDDKLRDFSKRAKEWFSSFRK